MMMKDDDERTSGDAKNRDNVKKPREIELVELD